MADILHLRCRHCGHPYKNGTNDYCQPCNLSLMYRAMPILLGMLLIPVPRPVAVPSRSSYLRGRSVPYPHLREIMD